LWAVLLWLNILAKRRISVEAIVHDHWARHGRNYYARHDYEAVEIAAADALIGALRARLAGLAESEVNGLRIASADDFEYRDSTDQSVSRNQGLRIRFEDVSRIVFRLSGTGTEGATLRVYLERYAPAHGDLRMAVGEALRPLIDAAEELAGIRERTGRDQPDVVT
jgi:phosphoglucomutase